MAEDFPRFDLAGQVVLVTGAARGLGRACALACAKAGADIALGLRDAKAATGKQLASEIESLGRRALPLQMDVAKLDQVEAAVAAAETAFGKLDVLVNNAGIGPENLAENVNEADFDATLTVNLKGTFFAAQAAGRRMIKRKSGRIINMSSQAGSVALKGEAIYCMTKAGIDHLTRCLAYEWAPHNVTVNAVAPTFIWTDGTRPSLENPDFYKETLARIPLGRIGQPMDVAGAVVFLASPAASLITGVSLRVDGGWSLA
ncbi:MAG TPA: glucose 1-dehydrogenase [Methylomirabilota bacterium]|nr:glucose 1-dehydrogenase [Methylomirabilota bacterium]